jgi:hypothetical protein
MQELQIGGTSQDSRFSGHGTGFTPRELHVTFARICDILW